MKKSLVALAALSTIAGSVAAQSSVTVYGRFDQQYSKVDTKTATTSTTTNTGVDGGIGGSRLGFRGTEDLGGGLKANFVFEFGVDAGENTGVGATRLGFADISDVKLGTVRMGRQVSPTKAVADSYNALGNNTNFTPGDASAITAFDNRISNAITYLTPTISGFSAQIQYADANTQTTQKDSTNLLNGSAAADGAAVGSTGNPGSTSTAGYRVTKQGEIQAAGINYTVGKLSIAAAKQMQKAYNAGTASQNDITIIAATYDFGVLKAHLDQSTRVSDSAGVTQADRKVTTLGVTVPVMPKVIVFGQFIDGSRKASSGTNTFITTAETTAADFSGYKVRANYEFSKRTGVYGQLGQTTTKPADGSQKTTLQGYGLGMYHTF